ncbi:MAG TPA: hypothetical protein VM715_04780 [Candidatus Acidoferrum sp.]|nr:hypothetical protein [Candidatus Acidoferrum sp.]
MCDHEWNYQKQECIRCGMTVEEYVQAGNEDPMETVDVEDGYL